MNRKLLTRIVFFIAVTFGIFKSSNVCSQITVVSKSLNSFWVTPESVVKVGLYNPTSQQRIVLEGKLFNSTGELLLRVLSFPFELPGGVHNDLSIQIQVSEFISSNQSEFIRLNHVLPSGKYNLCYTISSDHGEPLFDNCDEIVSDFNSNLYLVSPFDQEIIDTKYPLLVWHHTEPFDVLNAGEFFRVCVVEKQKDQSAGSAITTNIPVFIKDFLLSHQIPYSIDAVALEEGKQYAWEVQKISQGAIIQKTETWTFSLREKNKVKDFKYVSLTKSLDAGFYTAVNGKIFFRFDEEYLNERIQCTVLDGMNKSITISPQNEKKDEATGDIIDHGYNRFELDLNPYKLSSGFYVLQIVNRKKEVYKLKFYIE